VKGVENVHDIAMRVQSIENKIKLLSKEVTFVKRNQKSETPAVQKLLAQDDTYRAGALYARIYNDF